MATTYVPIQTIECTETTSTITFSNIPQDYTDLVLRMNLLNVGGGAVRVVFNNDNTSNYHQVVGYQGNGSTFTSNYDSGVAYFTQDYFTPSTTRFTTYLLDINSYTSTTLRKAIIEQSGDAGLGQVFSVGLWKKTPIEPITSIRLEKSAGSFAAGSTATIYGIKVGSPKAFGGDRITTDGTYWYHTFFTTGRFEPQVSMSVDYLVVAGGGGGGGTSADAAGGGGAGGLRSTVTATGGGGSLESPISVNAQAYIITVGAGGAGGVFNESANGINGSDSTFSTITSTGGGGGGRGTNSLTYGGNTGGSGGGGSAHSGAGGARTINQGFVGGSGGDGSGGGAGGGGGGAGAVGTNGVNSTGGNGGNGVAVSISGSSVTYAGGGGGGCNNFGGFSSGSGGSGGGGGGNTPNSAGVAGTANTGGGGGAAARNSGGGDRLGGSGGSGIVIVRYTA